jgi:hypothetical protein
MSAVLFKFHRDNLILTNYVQANTLSTINTWQAREEYDFELHSGHLTGYPIYVRPELRARDTSNIPKFDTLNKSAADYDLISKFANSEKLDPLPLQARNEILQLVRDNWIAFAELAQNYWNATPVSNRTAEEIEEEAWTATETADSGPLVVRNRADFRNAYFLG